MKISLNWLTDYVDVTIPAQELAALLMRIGFPVEGIDENERDIVLDVEITSNRPDALGHIGIAREVAAVTGKPLKLPALDGIPVAGDVSALTSVEVRNPAFCPRYTARLLRGVKVGPSPAWMVERLEAAGLRSINNVVDATNYVLMEYSQPLHAFDFDTLEERRIVVRQAIDGERITAIDGTKHELRDWMGIIADERRPIAVAGVMGGLDTEVSEKTTNVLIEAAQFDPLSIRRTSRHLGLMSESSYRFERGIDPVALERASLRACQLIMQMGGGQLATGVVDVWAKPFEPAKVTLRPQRCNALLSLEIPVERQVAILDSLGLVPQQLGQTIACAIPPHRADLAREVDLIEEIARIHGYDKIPVGGSVTHEVRPPARLESSRRAVGEVLAAAGYFEAITFTFIDDEEAELFGWLNSLVVDRRLRKTNGVLRQGLLPSLLRTRKTNQDAGNEDVRLFELSAVFPPTGKDSLPAEYTQLGMITDGTLQDLRGALEAVARRFSPGGRLEVRAAEAIGFAAGTAAELTLRVGDVARPFGILGVISEKVRDFYGLTASPAAAMARFDVLADLGESVRIYAAVPRLPAIRRDLSVVVDESVTWE
jgi:phenylalanyl-tRNA synthetase beta chain